MQTKSRRRVRHQPSLTVSKTKSKSTCNCPSFIYLDNNATTQPYPEVLEVMSEVSFKYFANPSSSHVLGTCANKELVKYRCEITKYLGIKHPDQLVFTSGATESNNIVSRGRVAHCSKGQKRVHVVSSVVEHASIFVTLNDMKSHKQCDLSLVDVDKHGYIDITALDVALAKKGTCLVTLIIANNEIGTIQDTKQIMQVCRKYPGVHVHFDLTQMVGRYPLDFTAMGMDSASFSAHKFHGPRGVGGLYIRNPKEIDTVVTGGLQENNIRAGTENLAGIAGMAVALRLSLCRDRGANWKVALNRRIDTVRNLRDRLQQTLENRFPGKLILNGPQTTTHLHRPAVCSKLYNTFNFSQTMMKSTEVISQLGALGLCFSVGSACSKNTGSKTLKAIGLSDRQVKGTFRISLSHFTTREEIDQAADAITNFLRNSH